MTKFNSGLIFQVAVDTANIFRTKFAQNLIVVHFRGFSTYWTCVCVGVHIINTPVMVEGGTTGWDSLMLEQTHLPTRPFAIIFNTLVTTHEGTISLALSCEDARNIIPGTKAQRFVSKEQVTEI